MIRLLKQKANQLIANWLFAFVKNYFYKLAKAAS